jgi:Tfp pilus assembly pilus retraction ATPase PilT
MSVGSIKEHFTLSSSIIKLPWLWSSFQGQSAAGGRIAAFKIMMATNVIRRLIREERIFDIPPNIETGRLGGMQTLGQALADLVLGNLVAREEAMMRSSTPAKLDDLLRYSVQLA